MTLDDILFAQYQLGREHEAMVQRGEKRNGAEKVPSRDEICQKHFGKDYVWKNGYRSADFCVGDSGIPKYPKSWSKNEN